MSCPQVFSTSMIVVDKVEDSERVLAVHVDVVLDLEINDPGIGWEQGVDLAQLQGLWSLLDDRIDGDGETLPQVGIAFASRRRDQTLNRPFSGSAASVAPIMSP